MLLLQATARWAPVRPGNLCPLWTFPQSRGQPEPPISFKLHQTSSSPVSSDDRTVSHLNCSFVGTAVQPQMKTIHLLFLLWPWLLSRHVGPSFTVLHNSRQEPILAPRPCAPVGACAVSVGILCLPSLVFLSFLFLLEELCWSLTHSFFGRWGWFWGGSSQAWIKAPQPFVADIPSAPSRCPLSRR